MMKCIYEYILNSNSKIIRKKLFPDKPYLENFIEFLESNDFIKVNYDVKTGIAFDVLEKNALNTPKDAKLYLTSDAAWDKTKPVYWIRMCKGGEINGYNPVLCVRLSTDGKHPVYDYKIPELSFFELGGEKDYMVNFQDRILSYDKIKEIMKELFNLPHI